MLRNTIEINGFVWGLGEPPRLGFYPTRSVLVYLDQRVAKSQKNRGSLTKMKPLSQERLKALVQYTDDFIHLCKITDISASKKSCAVRYTDRRKYAARVLMFGVNLELLKCIQHHIRGDSPHVHPENLKYTGQQFTCAEILEAKNNTEDKRKIFIGEGILPKCTDQDAQYYKFDLDGTSTEMDRNSIFLEAIEAEEANNLQILETDNLSTNDIDASKIENHDQCMDTISEQVQNDDSTNDNFSQVHKLDTTCLPVVGSNGETVHTESELIHADGGPNIQPAIIKNGQDDRENVCSEEHELTTPCSPVFDKNKEIVPTDSELIDTEAEHIHEDEKREILTAISKTTDEGTDAIPAQVHAASCSSTKPVVKCIEKVQYELVRVPHPTDSTDVEGLSNIETLLDNNPAILKMFADDASNETLKGIVLDDIISAKNSQQISRSCESFEMHNPVMSSTVINSTTSQSISTNRTEDTSNTNEKDKDYEVSESYAGGNDATADSSREKSGDNTALTFHVPGKPFSTPDDSEMRVQSSATTSHSKKYFCFYCKKLQTKLARHLEKVHGGEEDVKKFISLPKNNSERHQIIAIIRKNGNHLFNSDPRFNDGNLIVCRRPNQRMNKTAKDFTACAKCKGQYAKSVIRHHWRKCTERFQSTRTIVIVKGRAIMARVNAKADDAVRKHIFSYLREDDVVRGIRYDEAVILYANKQCDRLGMHHHQYQGVRAQVRLLGRFLIAIKGANSTITDFASIFTPKCYDSCITAAKEVANFDEKTRTFEHPTVASHLGTLLKHVGEVLRSKYIKSEDEKQQKKVEDFLKILNGDYGTAINRAVAETQAQNLRRKKVVLPTAADIKKLQEYLKAEREKQQKILTAKFSDQVWRSLAGVVLTSLQIFNRRRAGEMERIYIKDFESYEGLDAVGNKEFFKSLSKEARELAKKYVRFMIRGKRGRGVPVLVPSQLLESMKLIQKFRRQAKVSDENPYFFGLRGDDPERHSYLRACNLMRTFSSACGAKVSTSLRRTELRKHIATHCINLNLSETQVSDLANFMGHHEKIHKDIYRQPIAERDIIKISKLLELAQGTAHDAERETASECDSEEEEVIGENLNEKNIECPPTEEDAESTYVSVPSTRSSKVTLLKTRSTNMTAPSTIPKSCKRKKSPTNMGIENKKRRVSESRRPWRETERCAVLKAFEKYMEGQKLPSLSQIEEVISKNKCPRGRTGPQVKTWLHNERKKRSL